MVIGAHRKQIEDTMESVRVEMALLQEVDRPGSAIDDYVSGLTAILAARAASIAELQARLATFQRHLKEEEVRAVVCRLLRHSGGALPAAGRPCPSALHRLALTSPGWRASFPRS